MTTGTTQPAATDISVGEIVEGAIDHSFDFDYFRIRVEAGKRYRLWTEGVTLAFSRVDLYESDGVTWTEQYTAGWHRVRGDWTSPNSGEYYLAAQGAYSSVGTYTFIVSKADSPWVELTP